MPALAYRTIYRTFVRLSVAVLSLWHRAGEAAVAVGMGWVG